MMLMKIRREGERMPFFVILLRKSGGPFASRREARDDKVL